MKEYRISIIPPRFNEYDSNNPCLAKMRFWKKTKSFGEAQRLATEYRKLGLTVTVEKMVTEIEVME